MFKFNGGNGAIICDYCRIILKSPAKENECDKRLALDLCKECAAGGILTTIQCPSCYKEVDEDDVEDNGNCAICNGAEGVIW